MGLDSQMTWIKKDFPHSPWKWHREDFSTALRSFISCLNRKHNNLILFCEESHTWSLHTFRKFFCDGCQAHAEPWPPSDLPCVQTQLRHFQAFLTVAWWCLSEPGWIPTLAWNQKDTIFTRVGSSRHFFRCISPWGLNCQNTFETVCHETSLQGWPWDQ